MSRFGQSSSRRSSRGKYLLWTGLWAAIAVLAYVCVDPYTRLNSQSFVDDVTPPADRPYVEPSLNIPTWEFADRIIEADDMTKTIREMVRECDVDRKANAYAQWDYAEDRRGGDREVAHWLAVALYHPEDTEKAIHSLVIVARYFRFAYQSKEAEKRMLEYAGQVASASGVEDLYRSRLEKHRAFDAEIESASGP